MRMGTSWAAGASIPAGVPESLHPVIRAAETRLAKKKQRAAAENTADSGYWKLTWLEQQPHLTLLNGKAGEIEMVYPPMPGAGESIDISSQLGFSEDNDDWLQ